MPESEQSQTFAAWMRAHRGLLFKAVRAYARDEHDREDLFQEIAAQLWKSIPGFDGRSAVSTWIYRVALYTGIAWSRKEGGHAERREALPDAGSVLQEVPDRDPRLDWLYEQLGDLDPVDRSLTLLLLEGFSYADMASTLGITVSNVGVKIHRIKAWLTSRAPKEDEHEL